MEGVDICLHGHEQGVGCVGELAEHGLAADDDEFALAGDIGGGADEVLELRALHAVWPGSWPGSVSTECGQGLPVRSS